VNRLTVDKVKTKLTTITVIDWHIGCLF